jgi:hypothetical protein
MDFNGGSSMTLSDGKLCIKFFLTASVMLSASSSYAKEADLMQLPTTREGNYAVAQKFAHCGGHYEFAAFIAKRIDKNDVATAFEDQARGWKLAGMFFLSEAMSKERAADTEKTFDNLVYARVSQLKALHEIDPTSNGNDAIKDYNANCLPLVPTQKKLIELVRRG